MQESLNNIRKQARARRVQALGGALGVVPADGGGTCVEAVVPLAGARG